MATTGGRREDGGVQLPQLLAPPHHVGGVSLQALARHREVPAPVVQLDPAAVVGALARGQFAPAERLGPGPGGRALRVGVDDTQEVGGEGGERTARAEAVVQVRAGECQPGVTDRAEHDAYTVVFPAQVGGEGDVEGHPGGGVGALGRAAGARVEGGLVPAAPAAVLLGIPDPAPAHPAVEATQALRDSVGVDRQVFRLGGPIVAATGWIDFATWNIHDEGTRVVAARKRLQSTPGRGTRGVPFYRGLGTPVELRGPLPPCNSPPRSQSSSCAPRK
jgi:hypothetical protein